MRFLHVLVATSELNAAFNTLASQPAKIDGVLPEGRDNLPDDDDVIIWQLEEREGLDVYRVTKGDTVLGEFTGRSIGSVVPQRAVEHAEPGRAVWLRDDLWFRRLIPQSTHFSIRHRLAALGPPGTGLAPQRVLHPLPRP